MIGDFNFLYFSGVLFLIISAVIIALSYTSEAPDQKQIRGLTLSTIDRKTVRESWDRSDVIATSVILGLVAAIYLYFSFWV
jgi:SSS family solute:Na+ symporter